MRPRVWVMVGLLGCSTPASTSATSTPSTSATSTPSTTATAAPTSKGVSITIGGGGAKVTGGPSMHGASVACVAFQACCATHFGSATPPGMACDLAPVMSGGDCTRAVTIVRDSFAAQGTTPPAGCVVLGDLAGGTTSPSPRILIGAP